MGTLVHLCGPQLSGKTWAREQIQALGGDRVAAWDVLPWYQAHGVIDDAGRLDMRKLVETKPAMERDLQNWLSETAGADLRIVESSGISRSVEEALASVPHERIVLEPAPEDVSGARAHARGLDPQRVATFNAIVGRKLSEAGDPTCSAAAAVARMATILECHKMPDEIHAAVRFAVRLAESTDAGQKWYEILSVGKRWPRPLADDRGPFEITRATLDSLVATFEHEVPVDVHHASLRGSDNPEATKARGWITAIKRAGDKLLAAIRWTEEGAQWIASEAFRYFSAEIVPGRDTGGGKPAGVYLAGGTLTNRPVWDVPALALSEDVYKEIREMQGAAISPPVIPERNAVPPVVTKEATMPDDKQIMELSERLGEATKRVTELEAERGKGTAAAVALAEQVKAAETKAVALEAQVKRLSEESRKLREDKAIDALLSTGRITRGEEPAARKVYALDAALFAEVFEKRPEASKVPVGAPIGGTAADTTTAGKSDVQAEINALCEKLVAEKKAANFSEALTLGERTNPELYRRWAVSLAGEEV